MGRGLDFKGWTCSCVYARAQPPLQTAPSYGAFWLHFLCLWPGSLSMPLLPATWEACPSAGHSLSPHLHPWSPELSHSWYLLKAFVAEQTKENKPLLPSGGSGKEPACHHRR